MSAGGDSAPLRVLAGHPAAPFMRPIAFVTYVTRRRIFSQPGSGLNGHALER